MTQKPRRSSTRSPTRRREERLLAAFLALAVSAPTREAPALPRGKRVVRTWHCGEVGVMGTRYVLPGGYLAVAGRAYHSEKLNALAGEIVHFHDDDDAHGALSISRPIWHKNGAVSGDSGAWICRARHVDAFEQIATLAIADGRTLCSTKFSQMRGFETMAEMIRAEFLDLQRQYEKNGEEQVA